MLRFEPGIMCRVFRLEIALVIHHAAVWALLARIGVVVNSMGDRRHGPNSLHPWDLAIDLDTDGDKPDHLAQLHAYLARVLGPGYDVILETDHVHIEYDMKRGTPPIAPTFA